VGGPDAINEIVNVGYGEDIAIGELAKLAKEVVGFEGALTFDTSKPDGTRRKLLDSSRLHGTMDAERVDSWLGSSGRMRGFSRITLRRGSNRPARESEMLGRQSISAGETGCVERL
jgi:hypothetical protein